MPGKLKFQENSNNSAIIPEIAMSFPVLQGWEIRLQILTFSIFSKKNHIPNRGKTFSLCNSIDTSAKQLYNKTQTCSPSTTPPNRKTLHVFNKEQ